MNVSSISTHAAAPVEPAHHSPLKAAALKHASPAEQRAGVAQQFEAILVRQLLGKTMNSMLGSDKGGTAASVYGDMLTDTLSQQLTAGPGLGLGRFIQQQLTPRGVPVDPAAAPAQPANPVRP